MVHVGYCSGCTIREFYMLCCNMCVLYYLLTIIFHPKSHLHVGTIPHARLFRYSHCTCPRATFQIHLSVINACH